MKGRCSIVAHWMTTLLESILVGMLFPAHAHNHGYQMKNMERLLFLDVLPTDLHVSILQTWTGTKLPLLSALDIAFCNRPHRARFLEWIALACHQWKDSVGFDKKGNDAASMRLIRWMAARGISLQTLKLTHSFFLRWRSTKATLWDIDEINEILLASNSIVRLDVSTSYGGNIDALFSAFVMTPLPNLTALTITVHHSILGFSTFLAGLEALGGSLTELNLRVNTLPADVTCFLLDTIARTCKSLKVLEIDAVHVPTAKLVLFLQQSQLLMELKMGRFCGTDAELRRIFAAGQPHLKSINFDAGHRGCVLLLMNILVRHSSLDTVSVSGNSYCRSSGRLRFSPISCGRMESADLDCTVRACANVFELKLPTNMLRKPEHLMRMGEAYGSKLIILRLSGFALRCLTVLLPCCANLRQFHTTHDVDPLLLGLVAAHCKKLEILVLSNFFSDDEHSPPPPICDSDMEELFANCSQLREVSVGNSADLSFCTLQAILDHHLPIVRFTCEAKATLDDADVERFYRLAKLQGLLPVPQVLKNCVVTV